MEKRLYHICLWGSEDSRDCSMMLTEEEADILCRLEDELHPLNGYVPHIYVVDVEKSEEEARKLEEKKAAEAKQKMEEERAELLKSLGIADNFHKTAMQMAFEMAKAKKEG